MNRLNTDRSLAPLVAQFVPLKVSTDAADSWRQWSSRYRADGNGIPMIFVVRADGQQLYGKSGSLDTPALGQLMVQTLAQAGRIFTPAELTTLSESVAAAKKARDEGDVFTAVVKLKTLKRFGDLGDFKSFAKPALEADALAKDLTEEGQTQLDAAREQLAEKPDDFAAVLAYTESKRIYGQLPTLERVFAEAARAVEKDLDETPVFRQAEAISRARSYAQTVRGGEKRAIETLSRLIAQFPATPAAELAQAEIRALGGEPVATAPSTAALAANATPMPSPGAAPLRTWTDNTGQFRIEARLVSVQGGAVTLQRADGRSLNVPLDRLSPADQNYVRLQAPN